MALLAEELVEEWLNRKGHFTIRGAKLGVHEMDLLAIRGDERRHVEVQASVNPISYLFPLPKEIQKATGRGPSSAKRRSEDELDKGADEWVARKFDHPKKVELRSRLAPGKWTREVVLHELHHEEEILPRLAERGVIVHRLRDVLADLRRGGGVITKAAGGDFVDLVSVGEATPSADGED